MSVKGTGTQELNGRIPSKKTHSSDSLIERNPIDGTPFTAVKKDDMWFISWGNYRMTENRMTEQEALGMLETNLWDIISVYILAVMSETEKFRRIQQQQEEAARDAANK